MKRRLRNGAYAVAILSLIVAGAAAAPPSLNIPDTDWRLGSESGPNGLIGHWPFNETSGTTVRDSSPIGRDGTAFNGVVLGEPGARGTGFGFDGTNDVVVVPFKPIWGNNFNITIGAFISTDVSPFTDRDAAEIGFHSRLMDSSVSATLPSAQFMNTAGNFVGGLLGTTVLEPNTYYCIFATKTTDTHTLYVNGTVEDREYGTFGRINTVVNTQQNLWVGSNAPETKRWDGHIDEYQIWQRALSQAEIQSICDGKTFGGAGDGGAGDDGRQGDEAAQSSLVQVWSAVNDTRDDLRSARDLLWSLHNTTQADVLAARDTLWAQHNNTLSRIDAFWAHHNATSEGHHSALLDAWARLNDTALQSSLLEVWTTLNSTAKQSALLEFWTDFNQTSSNHHANLLSAWARLNDTALQSSLLEVWDSVNNTATAAAPDAAKQSTLNAVWTTLNLTAKQSALLEFWADFNATSAGDHSALLSIWSTLNETAKQSALLEFWTDFNQTSSNHHANLLSAWARLNDTALQSSLLEVWDSVNNTATGPDSAKQSTLNAVWTTLNLTSKQSTLLEFWTDYNATAAANVATLISGHDAIGVYLAAFEARLNATIEATHPGVANATQETVNDTRSWAAFVANGYVTPANGSKASTQWIIDTPHDLPIVERRGILYASVHYQRPQSSTNTNATYEIRVDGTALDGCRWTYQRQAGLPLDPSLSKSMDPLISCPLPAGMSDGAHTFEILPLAASTFQGSTFYATAEFTETVESPISLIVGTVLLPEGGGILALQSLPGITESETTALLLFLGFLVFAMLRGWLFVGFASLIGVLGSIINIGEYDFLWSLMLLVLAFFLEAWVDWKQKQIEADPDS